MSRSTGSWKVDAATYEDLPSTLVVEELQDLPQTFALARKRKDLAVLEGFHAIKHALRFGAHVRQVVAVDPDSLENLAEELAPDLHGVFRRIAQQVPPDVFKRLSKSVPHTEVMAIAYRSEVNVTALLQDQSPRPIIFLDDPRNLGNLGAVIRVAAAADVVAVLTRGVNDPWDPTAIRGSAGLHYAVPVARVPQLPSGSRPVVAVDPEGSALRPGVLPDRAILAFGTERHGLTDDLLARADMRVRIPMRPGVSSLNLATSVAVLLYSSTWVDSR
jgi:TrmH family RNA methyltransferase